MNTVLKRIPRPALRPFIETLWATDETSEAPPHEGRREHVLPTGQMHLVFRLGAEPLRVFDDAGDTSGRIVGHALVGGARRSFYIRDVSRPLSSVGAQLRPGAAQALFGVPADELAGRHTPLDDLWGHPAASMRGQLAESGSLGHRLDLLEAMLASRVARARGVHPAVARALEQFMTYPRVDDVVKRSGFSHRTFISLFRESVGLTPKVYCRVLRFQHVLRRLSGRIGVSWVDVAMSAGYSDQAHFGREFREVAGATPTQYRHVSPRFPHHLRVDTVRR